MRQVKVTRHEGRWWSLPWTACLYEDGVIKTCAVRATRKGALRELKRKIAYHDRPAPGIISREDVPYERL